MRHSDAITPDPLLRRDHAHLTHSELGCAAPGDRCGRTRLARRDLRSERTGNLHGGTALRPGVATAPASADGCVYRLRPAETPVALVRCQ